MLSIFIICIFSLYVFSFSSLHSLVFLLFVEVLVLSVLLNFFILGFHWFFCLMLLLIGVCLGALGISLYVSISRSKGSDHCFSF